MQQFTPSLCRTDLESSIELKIGGDGFAIIHPRYEEGESLSQPMSPEFKSANSLFEPLAQLLQVVAELSVHYVSRTDRDLSMILAGGEFYMPNK